MRVEWSSILFPFLLLLLLLLPSTREIEQNFASSSWLAGGVTRHSFVLLLAGKIEILAGIIDVPRRSRWEYTEGGRREASHRECCASLAARVSRIRMKIRNASTLPPPSIYSAAYSTFDAGESGGIPGTQSRCREFFSEYRGYFSNNAKLRRSVGCLRV